MKKELGDTESEVFVLAHTEEVLAHQEGALVDSVKKIERKQGISVRGVERTLRCHGLGSSHACAGVLLHSGACVLHYVLLLTCMCKCTIVYCCSRARVC